MRGVLTPAVVAIFALAAVAYAQMPEATGTSVGAPSPRTTPARRARRTRRNEPGTIVTLPGFEMLSDGQSRFHCLVHGVVSTSQSQSPRRFEVTVPNARLGLRNDRRPLEMRFFDTPVLRHYLVRRGNDVVLVFEMRADATGTVRTESRPDGGTSIIVEFPPGQFMSDTDRQTLHDQAVEPTVEVPVSQTSTEAPTTSLAAIGTSARPAPTATQATPAAATSTTNDLDTGRPAAQQTQQQQPPQPRTPTTRTRYDPTLDALDNERPPIFNR